MNHSTAQDIRNVYLDNHKQALKGKQIIDSYLERNDAQGLAQLLRYHNEKKITNDETWLRDDIDYFLEYFSVLSLAHITGFLRPKELSTLGVEIAFYLGNIPLKRYYYKNYQLLLPQVLLECILSGKSLTYDEGESNSPASFETFHTLNQTIDNADVDQFLWFLDGGSNDDADIDDLREVLSDTKETFKILAKKPREALHQTVHGFFDYIVFLQELEQFLLNVSNKMHRSAYWYYHEYWFQKLESRLKGSIIQFFKGLERFSKQKSDSITEKVRALETIADSKQSYLNTIRNIAFENNYKETFEKYISTWRRQNLRPVS